MNIKTVTSVCEKVLKFTRANNRAGLENAWTDSHGRTCVLDGFRAYRINANLSLSTVPDEIDDNRMSLILESERSCFAPLDRAVVTPIPAPDENAVRVCIAEAKRDKSRNKNASVSFDFGPNLPAVNAEYLLDTIRLLPGAAWYKKPGAEGLVNAVFAVSEDGSALIMPVRVANKAWDKNLAETAPIHVDVPCPVELMREKTAETIADVLADVPKTKCTFDVYPDRVEYNANGHKSVNIIAYLPAENGVKAVYRAGNNFGKITFAESNDAYIPAMVLANQLDASGVLKHFAENFDEMGTGTGNRISAYVKFTDNMVTIIRNAGKIPSVNAVRKLIDLISDEARCLHDLHCEKPTVAYLSNAVKWFERMLHAEEHEDVITPEEMVALIRSQNLVA